MKKLLLVIVIILFVVLCFFSWRWYKTTVLCCNIPNDIAAMDNDDTAQIAIENTTNITENVAPVVSVGDKIVELGDKTLIYFPYSAKYKLEDPEINAYLKNLAAMLKDNTKKVTVTGNTDNLGDTHANDALGLARANSIKDLLIEYGLSPDRITAKSDGENSPLETNETPLGRQANRRVELLIL